MNGYPVLLNIQGWRCVIVGGGSVAARKAQDLLECGAQITVISPDLAPALHQVFRTEVFTWHQRAYSSGQITALQPQLVIAATDDRAVNAVVTREARAIGALVNCADSGDSSDFSNMIMLRRPPITVALSTGGASPALAVHLKEVLARAVGDEYVTLAQWLGDLRPIVQAKLSEQTARHALFQAIVDSDVLDYLRQGDQQAAHAVLTSLLEQQV